MNEIPNPEFKIKCPPIVCDVEFQNVPENMPNKSFSWTFVGRPGSGKTSLAINLIAEKAKGHRGYYRVFDNVIVLMPRGSLASLKKNPFESLPEDDVYHEFTLEALYDIEMKLEEWAAEDPPKNTLLFIDDLASELRCYGEMEKVYKRLSFNRRHLRLSIMNCVQRLTAIPKAVRATFSHITFFKCTKNENQILFDELLDISKERFVQLCEFCFRDKHDTIMVDLNNLEFFRNFNKLEDFIDPNEVMV